MKKHAVLIQTHKPIDYFIELAKRTPNVNFYVHFDKKCDDSLLTQYENLANIVIINHRIDVKWGGFSQVKATLALFDTAFANTDNQFFHLISGEDVVLQDFDTIEQNWKMQFNFAMMLTCELAPRYGYRFRSDTLHADTDWQRQFIGKVLTKGYQGLAKLSPYQQSVYFGSQWFSVTREDWAKILPFVDEYRQFFERKLVPDEHFFQTIIKEKLGQEKADLTVANDNKRFIIFDKAVNNGNSPLYLDLPKLQQAKNDGFWFARKVDKAVAMGWLENGASS
ncbi:MULTISPECIES: beta-1,6-N-acetylglucosaminyltransferase [unclassified Moraxella]|uniref:beta-1,6-N-acetylglucosaminyltransferase n=1 Tax=unclassified Moraxella TaxID=2685852 RepID=UPI003AF71582